MRRPKRAVEGVAEVGIPVRDDGIPKKFQLAGHTIEVRTVPRGKWRHGKDCIGIWLPEKNRIEIISSVKGSARQQVWAHEAIHAMLDIAGYGPIPKTEDLSRDEQFVDRLGHLLQQMLTTME
jgi:hypothetical protein